MFRPCTDDQIRDYEGRWADDLPQRIDRKERDEAHTQIGETRIYSRALTSTEISEIYQTKTQHENENDNV